MGNRVPVTSSAAYLLMKAGVLMSRSVDAALLSFDLTARQFLLMSVVGDAMTQSQLEVSRRLHLDPTIVVGVIDELERRGLVTRTRHSDDRRRYVLSLTLDGKRVLRSATARSAAAEAEFLAALAPAEQVAFREHLDRVVRPLLDQL